MTYDDKRSVRAEVERNGWTIISAGADMPSEFLEKPVLLMYEDMDGHAAICEAIYTFDRNAFRHSPYFMRTDGVHMINCIAWKYPPKEEL